MSLAAFEHFLMFAETTLRVKDQWSAHIDPHELESALVGYGVVLLHSHMEQCLKSAVKMRCARCPDAEVRTYALSVAENKTGKLAISMLNQTLNSFSGDCKKSFQDDLKASGMNASWDSVINIRKAVAHDGTPAAMTLSDLRVYYEEIRSVLGFFCKGIGLVTADAQSISPQIIMPPSPGGP